MPNSRAIVWRNDENIRNIRSSGGGVSEREREGDNERKRRENGEKVKSYTQKADFCIVFVF